MLIKEITRTHHPATSHMSFCASQNDSKDFCATTVQESLASVEKDCDFVVNCGLSHQPEMKFLPNPSVISIIMLRKPLFRSLSGYFHGWPHAQRTCSTASGTAERSSPNRTHAHPHCESLMQYLELPLYDNIMVRMLARGTYPYTRRGNLTERDVDLAVESLPLFDVVGLTELFLTSSALILSALDPSAATNAAEVAAHLRDSKEACTNAGGWETEMCRVGARIDSRSKYKQAIEVAEGVGDTKDQELRIRMENSNRLDIILFQRAQQIFCKQLTGKEIMSWPEVQAELQHADLCTAASD